MYIGGALVKKDVPDTRKRRGHKKRTLIVDIWLLILDPPGGGSLTKRCTRKRRGHQKTTLIVDIWLLILDPKCGLKQEEFASYNGEKRCDWSRREI